MQGRGGRTVLWALVLASLLTGLAGAPATAGSPPWIDALWSEPTSGFTGLTERRSGTLIHTDHVFDDGGPGTSATYPQDGEPYNRNAADLVEVRARRDGSTLSLGVRLNTLLDAVVPVIAIGVDHPAMAGKAAAWPGPGVTAEGARWMLTITGGEATVIDLASGQTATTIPVAMHNNTPPEGRHLENTLSLQVPLSTLELPKGTDQLKLRAVAGVRDPAGDGSWYRSDPEQETAAFDLAFVTAEGLDDFQQHPQAEWLADGDITAAVGSFALDGPAERPAQIPAGASTRIYRSRIETQIGEGVSAYSYPPVTPADEVHAPAGNLYRGLFLPYALWVPKNISAPANGWPAFMALHGLSSTHLSSTLFQAWADGSFDVPAVALSPLGRAEQGYYHGVSGLDVLEVLDDAKQALPIDDNRVFLSGFSMGGQGTYTLGTQRPDLFAAAIPVVGPGSGTGDFLWPAPLESVIGPNRDKIGIWRQGSFGRELLDNAINLPFRMFMGTVDPLTTVTFSEGDLERWEELGYDYQAGLFLTRSHQLVPEYVNALYHRVLHGCTAQPDVVGCQKDLASGSGFVRDRNPARVVYRALPLSWVPELGITYDGAYWVSEMQVRQVSSSDSFAKIDATSHGLADKLREQVEQWGPELRTYQPTGDNYKFQGRRWAVTPQDVANRADVSMENLAAVTLDLTRMQLDVTRPLTLAATGDGESTLRLRGAWRDQEGVTVTRDGEPFATLQATHGALELTDNIDGAHEYTLSTKGNTEVSSGGFNTTSTEAAASDEQAATAPGTSGTSQVLTLPATGSPPLSALGAVLLGLGGLAATRGRYTR